MHASLAEFTSCGEQREGGGGGWEKRKSHRRHVLNLRAGKVWGWNEECQIALLQSKGRTLWGWSLKTLLIEVRVLGGQAWGKPTGTTKNVSITPWQTPALSFHRRTGRAANPGIGLKRLSPQNYEAPQWTGSSQPIIG